MSFLSSLRLDSLRRQSTLALRENFLPGRRLLRVEEKHETAVCENIACGRAFPKTLNWIPLRFEGKLICSQPCWWGVLERRLRQESTAAAASHPATHAHRVPLGLLLVSLGYVTANELHVALDRQKSAGGGRIGEWLRESTGVTEDQIARALSMQWSCPIFDLSTYRAQSAGVPVEILQAYRALPLPSSGQQIMYLAFDGYVDSVVSYAVQHMTDVTVKAGLTAETAFREMWPLALAAQAPAASCTTVHSAGEIVESVRALHRAQEIFDIRIARVHQHLWIRVFGGGAASVTQHSFTRERPASFCDDHLYLLLEN